MTQKLINIADDKPKLNKLLDLILRLVISKDVGKLEVNFTQGNIGSVYFKKKEV